MTFPGKGVFSSLIMAPMPGAVCVWATGDVLDAVVVELEFSVLTVILRKATIVKAFVLTTMFWSWVWSWGYTRPLWIGSCRKSRTPS